MRSCEQMKNLSVLEHGFSVARYFRDLRNHVLFNTPLKYEWKLPEWAYSKEIWDKVFDLETIQTYQIYHDCGKPFCLYIDEDGRRHFPNHAEISQNIWERINGKSTVSKLIGMDMDVHLLKADDTENFISKKEAATLLLTGLSEIHSNAVMFGGIDSTSFKIKWKKINKIGKKLNLKLTKGEALYV